MVVVTTFWPGFMRVKYNTCYKLLTIFLHWTTIHLKQVQVWILHLKCFYFGSRRRTRICRRSSTASASPSSSTASARSTSSATSIHSAAASSPPTSSSPASPTQSASRRNWRDRKCRNSSSFIASTRIALRIASFATCSKTVRKKHVQNRKFKYFHNIHIIRFASAFNVPDLDKKPTQEVIRPPQGQLGRVSLMNYALHLLPPFQFPTFIHRFRTYRNCRTKKRRDFARFCERFEWRWRNADSWCTNTSKITTE